MHTHTCTHVVGTTVHSLFNGRIVRRIVQRIGAQFIRLHGFLNGVHVHDSKVAATALLAFSSLLFRAPMCTWGGSLGLLSERCTKAQTRTHSQWAMQRNDNERQCDVQSFVSRVP